MPNTKGRKKAIFRELFPTAREIHSPKYGNRDPLASQYRFNRNSIKISVILKTEFLKKYITFS